MLVYRVEQYKTGFGPYQTKKHLKETKSKLMLDSMFDRHADDNHPNWSRDKLPHYSYLHAGFFSNQDLINWFSGYFKELHKLKFKISVYETEECYEGISRKQINFKKGTKIREYRIPEFLMLKHETLSRL